MTKSVMCVCVWVSVCVRGGPLQNQPSVWAIVQTSPSLPCILIHFLPNDVSLSPLSHISLPTLTHLSPHSHSPVAPLSHISLPTLTLLSPHSHTSLSPLSFSCRPTLTHLSPHSHSPVAPLSHISLPTLTLLPPITLGWHLGRTHDPQPCVRCGRVRAVEETYEGQPGLQGTLDRTPGP
jgi:hypothetical protein